MIYNKCAYLKTVHVSADSVVEFVTQQHIKAYGYFPIPLYCSQSVWFKILKGCSFVRWSCPQGRYLKIQFAFYYLAFQRPLDPRNSLKADKHPSLSFCHLTPK